MPDKGIIRPYQTGIFVLQQALEAIVICGLLYLLSDHFHPQWSELYDVVAVVTTLAYLVLGRYQGLYSSWRGASPLAEVFAIGKVWLLLVVALLLAAYALKVSSNYSRATMLSWFLLTPLCLVSLRLSVRLGLRYFRADGRNIRRVVIAGSGHGGKLLAQSIINNPWVGMRLEGYYDDEAPVGTQPDPELPATVLGNLEQLIFDARTGNYDGIYIALAGKDEDKLKALMRELANSSIPVNYVPDLFTFDLMNARVYDIAGIPTISVYDSPLDGMGRLLKRLEDIVISAAILSVIAMPLIVIAMAIKLTSKGPVIFRQQRYGLGGQPISVWKFRSMSVTEEGDKARQATRNDPRVTPLGSVLRKTSLDELPQFINVLQGSMSIVGPRPHPIALNEEFREQIDGYMLRHIIKPGITGWAQVNGWRGETDTHEKMAKRIEFDLHYIRNWSLLLDLRIIGLTVFKGFINQQA